MLKLVRRSIHTKKQWQKETFWNTNGTGQDKYQWTELLK